MTNKIESGMISCAMEFSLYDAHGQYPLYTRDNNLVLMPHDRGGETYWKIAQTKNDIVDTLLGQFSIRQTVTQQWQLLLSTSAKILEREGYEVDMRVQDWGLQWVVDGQYRLRFYSDNLDLTQSTQSGWQIRIHYPATPWAGLPHMGAPFLSQLYPTRADAAEAIRIHRAISTVVSSDDIAEISAMTNGMFPMEDPLETVHSATTALDQYDRLIEQWQRQAISNEASLEHVDELLLPVDCLPTR